MRPRYGAVPGGVGLAGAAPPSGAGTRAPAA
jgi:hypothetical protein